MVTIGQMSEPEVIRRLLDLDAWGIHSDRPRLVVEAIRARDQFPAGRTP